MRVLFASKKWTIVAIGLLLSIISTGTALAQTIEPVDSLELAEPTGQAYEKASICSAYYSPLPGQGRYATGTYAGDIRLNGNGVHGASGMAVFPGMVAAPSVYPFGTKMFIPGLGMSTVADRGGAIQGNRLDIWFGFGEEALVRALQFGRRSCLVTVYGLDPGLSNSVTFAQGSVVKANASPDPFKFKNSLSLGSENESVERLQQFLKDMGYFKNTIDGKYGESTKEAVLKFQQSQGLIENPSVEVPGSFGATTIGRMELLLAAGRERYWEKVPSRSFGFGATGDEVKKLQEALNLLGYDVDINGIYDRLTVEAVLSFQLKEAVIADNSDQAAGYFGPKTQARLGQLMNELDVGKGFTVQSVEIVSEPDELISLKEGDSGDDVVELQNLLKDLHYLRVEPTGYFGPLTTHAVFKLQQKLRIVSSEADAEAGVVTAKTASALADYRLNKVKVAPQLVSQTRDLKKGMRGKDVKELQEFLKKKGYFPCVYTTEYFGDVTEDALMQFQVDFSLIQTFTDDNAGVFNKPTKELLAQLV